MAVSGDFLAGEDLEDIYYLLDGGFLDEEETIAAEVDEIATEVARDEENTEVFTCDTCQKICKSRRGLTRHINTKHKDSSVPPVPPIHSSSSSSTKLSATSTSKQTTLDEISWKKLHPLALKQIVLKCAEKLSQDECYDESFRDMFTKEKVSLSNEEGNVLWNKMRTVIDNFKGDAEKFYSSFMALLIENLLPTKFEEMYITNTLLMEVANVVLNHLSGNNIENLVLVEETTPLSDREYKSLQYLAGFILHKLSSKFQCSAKRKSSPYYEQYTSILKACKIDSDSTQTFVNARDRGGLWKVNEKTQKIFVNCEKVFRKATVHFTTKIVCAELVKEVMKDCSVLSYYNTICSTIDISINKELRKNVLEHMITLYFRVRTFSFAKDVREKYKVAKKKVRSRSLRTSIKIASSSTDLGH